MDCRPRANNSLIGTKKSSVMDGVDAGKPRGAAAPIRARSCHDLNRAELLDRKDSPGLDTAPRTEYDRCVPDRKGAEGCAGGVNGRATTSKTAGDRTGDSAVWRSAGAASESAR